MRNKRAPLSAYVCHFISTFSETTELCKLKRNVKPFILHFYSIIFLPQEAQSLKQGQRKVLKTWMNKISTDSQHRNEFKVSIFLSSVLSRFKREVCERLLVKMQPSGRDDALKDFSLFSLQIPLYIPHYRDEEYAITSSAKKI